MIRQKKRSVCCLHKKLDYDLPPMVSLHLMIQRKKINSFLLNSIKHVFYDGLMTWRLQWHTALNWVANIFPASGCLKALSRGCHFSADSAVSGVACVCSYWMVWEHAMAATFPVLPAALVPVLPFSPGKWQYWRTLISTFTWKTCLFTRQQPRRKLWTCSSWGTPTGWLRR